MEGRWKKKEVKAYLTRQVLLRKVVLPDFEHGHRISSGRIGRRKSLRYMTRAYGVVLMQLAS
jgi:hypothetical protein